MNGADSSQKYGDNWRMIHRMIHNILNIKAAATYVPYQDLECKIMLAGLLDTPDDLHNQLRRFTYSLSTQIIFGFRSGSIQDPNLQQLFWVRISSQGRVERATTDFFPRASPNGANFPAVVAPKSPTCIQSFNGCLDQSRQTSATQSIYIKRRRRSMLDTG